jgi:hypothetical protein
MQFFRRLQAPPNPLHETYTAATGRTVQDATAGPADTPDWTPVDLTPWQPIFAALAFHAENPGVPDHTTPGLPPLTTGEAQ